MTDQGIASWSFGDTPISVIDFETTGLTPGSDRVVEAAIVRIDPGEKPRLVLNTLVDPLRPISATEIHGITDSDVRDAPTFADIAGDVLEALSGTVVAAYNVYFDMRFLEFELRQVGVEVIPPHFCLMYLRPTLDLGERCRLEQACQDQHISFQSTHMAAIDATASGELFLRYVDRASELGILTFGDLAKRKHYKFTKSFANPPLDRSELWQLPLTGKSKARDSSTIPTRIDGPRRDLVLYWDTLTTIVADLMITDEELRMAHEARWGLPLEEVRALHARIFSDAITRFTNDDWLDDDEVTKLHDLHGCLTALGWAPGNEPS